MKKDLRPYLKDILESIEKIKEYTKEIKEENFYQDTQTQDAVLRRLEVMGEAVKNIPKDFKNKYPEVPWKKIAGMRDVLIHEYFGVNIKRIWKLAKDDLPGLKDNILKILDEIKNHEPSLF